MATKPNYADDEELVFTGEAIQCMDSVVDQVWENLFAAVVEKAESAGQRYVTEGDVRSCIHQALLKVMKKEESPVQVRG